MRVIPTSVVALGVSGLLFSACSNLAAPDLSPNRYASFNAVAKNNGATRAAGLATVIFFEGLNVVVPNSAQQQSDQCIVTAADTAETFTTGARNVGANLGLTAGAVSWSLGLNSSFQRYETTSAQPFAYNAGESATITIPNGGDVFPASSHTLKLAEPIVPGPLTVPAAGQDWQITWNGSNDNVASVQLRLRYANPATNPVANEQLYCVLRDDGATVLPASSLAAFLASPAARRSVRLLRWRTSEKLLDDRTLLHMSSTVDTVVTFP
jgi:hypothetical protein